MRFAANTLRLIVAILLCWFILTAVLVVGWVARMSRRAAIGRLLRRRGRVSVQAASDGNEMFARNAHWPGWIAAPAGFRRGLGGWLGGLWENLRLGLACLIPTIIVTAPAGILWLLSWWGGWNNSFNKGYEQSWVGPAVGFTGILLWLVVAPLIPLAQARVAVTGDWRSFFGLRVLRRIAARRRWALFLLALVAVAGAFWLLFIRAMPSFLLQNQIAGFEQMSTTQLQQLQLIFYLSTGAVMLAGFLLLHVWAARLYAAGLDRALQGGFLHTEQLHEKERALLQAVDAAPVRDGAAPARSGRPHGAVRGLNAAFALPLTLIAWFLVAALLYVAQFMLYAPENWLVHPVIHLPWVRVFGVG